MAADRLPSTPALRLLRQHRVEAQCHQYAYAAKGGAAAAAAALGIELHDMIKTLVFERDDGQPFLILMHGDREVSTKRLARSIGVKRVAPCTPDTATRHSGYQVGGTSPFGTRKPMPLYAEHSVLSAPKIYVNGGSRGLILELASSDLVQILNPQPVRVAVCP